MCVCVCVCVPAGLTSQLYCTLSPIRVQKDPPAHCFSLTHLEADLYVQTSAASHLILIVYLLTLLLLSSCFYTKQYNIFTYMQLYRCISQDYLVFHDKNHQYTQTTDNTPIIIKDNCFSKITVQIVMNNSLKKPQSE